MQDIAGPNSVYYLAQLAQVPVRTPPDQVVPVTAASNSGQATDWTAGQHQQSQHQQAAKVSAPKAERDDAITLRLPQLTGPTPAFEANILEVETDLREAIARIESARQGAWLTDGASPRADRTDAAALSSQITAETNAETARQEAATATAQAAEPQPEAESFASLSVA